MDFHFLSSRSTHTIGNNRSRTRKWSSRMELDLNINSTITIESRTELTILQWWRMNAIRRMLSSRKIIALILDSICYFFSGTQQFVSSVLARVLGASSVSPFCVAHSSTHHYVLRAQCTRIQSNSLLFFSSTCVEVENRNRNQRLISENANKAWKSWIRRWSA